MEAWYGWKNGHIVAEYPSRFEADLALDKPFNQRTIDAISPKPVEHEMAVKHWVWTGHPEWRAECSCGWRGDRTSYVEAEGELRCHRAAVNHEGIA